MKLVTATPNALYCDTDQVLTPATCGILKARGIKGVFRYLSGLFQPELSVILGSGLELYFVNYSRDPGWMPSAAAGTSDAARDLAALTRLSIPVGVHVAFDLESPGGTATDVIAHVTAHGTDIKKAFFLPSLYVGVNCLLNSPQLYALPSVLYWKSCSDLRDGSAGLVPACDYSITQGRPFNVVLTMPTYPPVGGPAPPPVTVEIDYDSVIEDLHGRLPIGVTA
jgi:hypothetical protein